MKFISVLVIEQKQHTGKVDQIYVQGQLEVSA